LHTSWQDGRAFCALIDAIQPGLIDVSSLPSNPEENLNLAFKTAQEKLQIPALLDVADVLTEKPDKFSIVTYLSQFAIKYAPLKESLFVKGPTVNQEEISPVTASLSTSDSVESHSNEIPLKCVKSGLDIPSGVQPVQFEGNIYHPSHFTCTKCSKILKKKPIALSNLPYCKTCGTKMIKQMLSTDNKEEKEDTVKHSQTNKKMTSTGHPQNSTTADSSTHTDPSSPPLQEDPEKDSVPPKLSKNIPSWKTAVEIKKSKLKEKKTHSGNTVGNYFGFRGNQ
jgi:ssDNA-binding Zn-finger/Zn-ribbon topoisomerase 1